MRLSGSTLGLLRNLGWMGMTTGLRLISGMATFVIVARLLGPENFGIYMFWMSVAGLLTLLVNFGFTPLVLREIGADPMGATVLMSEVLTARLILSSLVLAGGAVASAIWLSGTQTFVLAVLFFALLADAMTDLFNVGFRATNRFALETQLTTIAAVLQFVIVALSTWLLPQLKVAAMAFLLSRALVMLLTWWVQRSHFSGISIVPMRQAVQRIRHAVAYAWDFGLQSLFGQIDSVVLNHYLGPVAVGVFQAGMRFFNGGAQAANILANVFLPRAASVSAQPEMLRKESVRIQWAFVGVGLAFGWFLALGADWIVDLFFGAAYADLARVLPWLGLFFFVRFFAASWGIVLTAAGLQRFRAFCNAYQWIGALLLAVWLVPQWGVIGWVMCVLAGNVFLLVAYCLRGLRLTGQGLAQPIVAASAGLTFIPFLHSPFLSAGLAQ